MVIPPDVGDVMGSALKIRDDLNAFWSFGAGLALESYGRAAALGLWDRECFGGDAPG